jgi:hypothetical protein
LNVKTKVYLSQKTNISDLLRVTNLRLFRIDVLQAATKKVDQKVQKYNKLRPHFSKDMETPRYRQAAVNNNLKS